LEYQALTGLTSGQLHVLVLIVTGEIGGIVKPGAKNPPTTWLFHSVVVVAALTRRNLIQGAAGEISGCSQPNREPPAGSAAAG
jgi:hypothetical protein